MAQRSEVLLVSLFGPAKLCWCPHPFVTSEAHLAPHLVQTQSVPCTVWPISAPCAAGSWAMVSLGHVGFLFLLPHQPPASSATGCWREVGTGTSLRKETLWEMELAAGGDTEVCLLSHAGAST